MNTHILLGLTTHDDFHKAFFCHVWRAQQKSFTTHWVGDQQELPLNSVNWARKACWPHGLEDGRTWLVFGFTSHLDTMNVDDFLDENDLPDMDEDDMIDFAELGLSHSETRPTNAPETEVALQKTTDVQAPLQVKQSISTPDVEHTQEKKDANAQLYSEAFNLAKGAVQADQQGHYPQAIQLYTEASGAFIKVYFFNPCSVL